MNRQQQAAMSTIERAAKSEFGAVLSREHAIEIIDMLCAPIVTEMLFDRLRWIAMHGPLPNLAPKPVDAVLRAREFIAKREGATYATPAGLEFVAHWLPA